MEEDKKHLEFMNSIKKYDADVPSEAEVGADGAAEGQHRGLTLPRPAHPGHFG